jgi:SAM-dependent methyltransferase
MKATTPDPGFERFGTGAAKYAEYLDTPEGRLRLDLSFANLQEFIPRAAQPLRALDVGGGTGALAIRLAKSGLHVTLLDTSLPMLDLAKQASQKAGVAERIVLQHGDAGDLANLFPAESFDVVLCHNILEYVADPFAVLQSAAHRLRDRSSIISILVRNQAGEVLNAVTKGDLAAAEHVLTEKSARESLYGGTVRLFTPEGVRAMLAKFSLVVFAERGVRVASDYLPPQVSRTAEYEHIFQLERKLGMRPDFGPIARYLQYVARPQGLAT